LHPLGGSGIASRACFKTFERIPAAPTDQPVYDDVIVLFNPFLKFIPV